MAKKKITPKKPAVKTAEVRKSLKNPGGFGGGGWSDKNIKSDIVLVVW